MSPLRRVFFNAFSPSNIKTVFRDSSRQKTKNKIGGLMAAGYDVINGWGPVGKNGTTEEVIKVESGYPLGVPRKPLVSSTSSYN